MSLPGVGAIEIRPVTMQDEAVVFQVYQQCEDFLALGPESRASLGMVRKDITEAERSGGRFCGIFAANGSIMGVVTFLSSHFEGDPEKAFLSLIMIARPYRHKGVGTFVIQTIENEIRKNPDVAAIVSAVQVNNPEARRFWEKNGYHVVSKPDVQPDQTTTVRLEKRLRSNDLRDQMPMSESLTSWPTEVHLVRASLTPPAQLRELFLELGDGETGFFGTPVGRGEMSPAEYVQSCINGTDPAKLKPGLVPQTVFWIVDRSDTAVGMVRVRHCLNDKLLHCGGHIGFFVRPAWRGQGYAKLALRMALGELRKLGEKRALLTVREDNAASIQTIRACGGVLENTVGDKDGRRTMRFWIDLDKISHACQDTAFAPP